MRKVDVLFLRACGLLFLCSYLPSSLSLPALPAALLYYLLSASLSSPSFSPIPLLPPLHSFAGGSKARKKGNQMKNVSTVAALLCPASCPLCCCRPFALSSPFCCLFPSSPLHPCAPAAAFNRYPKRTLAAKGPTQSACPAHQIALPP